MSDIATKLVKVAERQQVLYDKGVADGEQAGYDKGVADGVTDGRQAAYDAFWDAYQNSGYRVQYVGAFSGSGWTNDSFKPKYSMRPVTAGNMFAYSMIEGDLTEILDELGIELSFANSGAHSGLFQGSLFTAIGDVSLINSNAFTSIFNGCHNLKKIGIITVKSTQSLSTFLNSATNLEEVQFAGAIGKTGFVVSSCTKLTHDSLMSIINCLVDYSESTSTYKITFGSTNLAKLTDDEKLQIEAKGWTYA